MGACYDCHSNETRWPLYSSVAPMSWLVQRDVEGGWRKLSEGSMPPRNYRMLHGDARLSDAEKRRT